MVTQIQYKRGTAAAWTSLNPVLADGERGYEKDTKRWKTGDGVTAWTTLPYVWGKTEADAAYVLGSTKGQANGVATLGSDGRLPVGQISAGSLTKWQPNTVYAAGALAVTPNGDVLSALAHTSRPSYDSTEAASWQVSAAMALGAGEIAEAYVSATLSGQALNAVVGLVAVNLRAGRRYSARFRFNTVCTAVSNGLNMSLVKSATNVTDSTGTNVDDSGIIWTAPTSGSSQVSLMEWSWLQGADETVNLKAVASRVAGAGTFDAASRRLKIYDDGKQF